ncbi:MAG: nodulation protein NfeD [Actinomycetota bacterium]
MKASRGARRRAVVWLLLVLGGSLLAGPSARAQQEGRPVVSLAEVEGAIDPPTADFLASQIAAAQGPDTIALIIQLDTPGGLATSMRDIIQAELDSETPIVVWVAPRGARAASAGTFIAYAAHLTYMAGATEIGAATPIDLAGDASGSLPTKVINDAAAFLREIAIERGRNPDWAEDAVREGASIGATEAARIDVVDGMASSLSELLEALDGQTAGPGGEVLETWDHDEGTPSAVVRFQNMNAIQELLHLVTDPEIAFLLILIGTFGIIFELYNPGIGLAGLLGAVSLLLGFYALSVLPTNWAGVLLVMLAVAFLLVDLHTAGFGVWTAGGVAALVVGGAILFSGAPAELRLSPGTIAFAVALTLIFFVSVMTAALRVRLRRPVTGEEGIVGTIGEATTDIAPEGTVLTKGALWRARTMETGIAQGERVKIMATEGLILLVEPLHESPDG